MLIEIRSVKMNLSQFYIDGNWVDPVGNQKLDVINPATEETVGQLSLGSEKDVDLAVSAAKKAFGTFSRTSVVERLELLTEIRNIYKRRYNEVAEAILTEMGAPITLASGAQSSVGLAHLKTAIRVLNDKDFEYKHNNMLIREEPIGVCGLITPWNWPINQVVSKLAPCLAAGCTSVLKPSEISPLSAIIFAEIMHEAGTPAGVFNMVHGYGPIVGEAMSKHPNIDMMSFTGSTRGGVSVAKSSAETVKRVSQELGGKSPNIILDDACFEQSVSRGVSGCMNNTGQSCNAPTRMLVPKNRHDEAAQIAKRVAESMKTGDPKSNDTDIGPLVSETQLKKVQKLVESGINSEATLVTGGVGKPAGLNKGYYVKPTVFSNVHNQMEIARTEIFGPVLSIIPFENEDEAVKIANDTPYGLTNYIQTQDKDKVKRVARKLRSGMVDVNGVGIDGASPFGGYKHSGIGREAGLEGLIEFLEIKSVGGFN